MELATSMNAPAQSTPPASAPESSAERKGLNISQAAVDFAREKLKKRGTPDAAIRLGIKGGGCSGFSYVIQFEDDTPRDRDRTYELDGVRFIV
ncbi:MAG TPA: iron-sulfur cluster biosynthesis family protein, partial [Polyangiaceae bacterium]|nr:iron-sulfur cluster biosynthesis family protein [Polyangiaceae bacterium]